MFGACGDKNGEQKRRIGGGGDNGDGNIRKLGYEWVGSRVNVSHKCSQKSDNLCE